MAVRRKPLSARVLATLRAKAKKSKLFNLTDLKASYRRGQGAFLSTGSRPGIGMAQWAMARVNSFLNSIGKSRKRHDLDLHEKVLEHRRNLRKKRMGRG